MARSFEARITILDVDERRAKPIFKAERRFDYMPSSDKADPHYLRATVVTELAKLYADSCVTITVDETIK